MKHVIAAIALMVFGLLQPLVEAQSIAHDDLLSLDKAVTLALQLHPTLRASRSLVLAAQHRVDQVNSAYFPQLFFNSSYTRWDWVLPNKKIFLDNSLNDIYAEFTVQQLLYNGGRTSAQSDLARNLADGEQTNNLRLRQSIAFSVSKAYLSLLKAERLVGVQELFVNNLGDHTKSAELLYHSGRVSQLDALKAKTQLALANEELMKAQNAVAVRRQELLGAIGIDTVYEFRTQDFTETRWAREQGLVLSQDSLLSLLSRHPDLQRSELDIKAREFETSLAQSDYYPAVAIRGTYNWEDSQVLIGHKDWNIGIGLSLPIYQGGATQAGVEQAMARTEASRATYDALRQRLKTAVRTTLKTLDDTRSRVRSAAEVVRLAEESEKVASLKYHTGTGMMLDVLDAENVLSSARVNYIQVLTDYALAVAELEYDLGNSEGPSHE